MRYYFAHVEALLYRRNPDECLRWFINCEWAILSTNMVLASAFWDTNGIIIKNYMEKAIVIIFWIVLTKKWRKNDHILSKILFHHDIAPAIVNRFNSETLRVKVRIASSSILFAWLSTKRLCSVLMDKNLRPTQTQLVMWMDILRSSSFHFLKDYLTKLEHPVRNV